MNQTISKLFTLQWLKRWNKSAPWQTTGKWLTLSVVVGIVAGLGAIVFQWLSQAVRHYTLQAIAGFSTIEPAGEVEYFESLPPVFNPYLMLVVITLGGLLSGLIVYFFAPEAEGHGTDAAIEAFHHKRGRMRLRVPIVKTIASSITLGTGGSAGREGPIAQIGAGFGAAIGEWLNLPARDRRILLAAGLGAGVGSIFRAPLAGAIFAGEIMYRDTDIESDVIVPAAVASAIGYSVYSFGLPAELQFSPLFGHDLKFAVISIWELIPYTLLAVILSLASIFYIRVFYSTVNIFKKVPLPKYLRPALGGLLTGLVGIALYKAFGNDRSLLAVLGGGYGTLQQAFDSDIAVSALVFIVVAFAKMLTTALTIGSGGSGGVFGPSLVIGGCLGAATGQILMLVFPGFGIQPGAFAIVGMAGFFASSARAPISTILMVSEVTGEYTLLLPTIWVSMLGMLFNRRATLYEHQLRTRLDSPAHRGDYIVDVLEGMQVKDIFNAGNKVLTIHEGRSLDEIVHLLPMTAQRQFPVVDDADRLQGVFSAEDVRFYLFDDTLWKIANARDVMTWPVITLLQSDDLNTALRRFTLLNVDELPVVDAEDSLKVLGVVRREDLIAAYNKKLTEFKQITQSHA